MPTTAPKSTSTADWLKWAIGFTWAAILTVGGYVVNVEHRLTETETGQRQHLAAAADTKTDIYRRLDKGDENSAQVLKILSDVQVSVATIKGYLERPKPANQQ